FGPSAEASRGFAYALTAVVLKLIVRRIPVLVGIPAQIREHTLPVVGSVFLICVAVVLWHLLSVVGGWFGERARKTETQTDDLVLHFAIAGGRVAIVVGTALGVAYFFSMPATSILAGLSIGGLAFAIAARETLANLFGAGTLVTDRPFRSGDWIDTGTLQGSVEAVGIRSTRIRTAQDSVAIIPNGKLSEATINNLGTRRHRVIKLKILVTEGATPERLEGLIAAIRHRLEEDPLFLMKRTEIGVTDIGSDGVSIVITADINVRTDLEESLARHDLLMDLLRFAEDQRLRLGRGVELSAIQP
ncbi:MAG: mechanosensitive ion channel, partial [Verrucomicrobia bacterium]|nr:mechanosensitive ion channel [Verrucomicrobiota bacterium]